MKSRALRARAACGIYARLIETGRASRNHTGIHEKQDNCLVLIALTARWILRKRPDARRNRKAVYSVDIILMGEQYQYLRTTAATFPRIWA